MKKGRKPEYPEKIPDDVLKKKKKRHILKPENSSPNRDLNPLEAPAAAAEAVTVVVAVVVVVVEMMMLTITTTRTEQSTEISNLNKTASSCTVLSKGTLLFFYVLPPRVSFIPRGVEEAGCKIYSGAPTVSQTTG